MKKAYKAYHHFKGNNLSPSEKIERLIVKLILESPIPNNQREDSVVFELKHSSGCIQIARILAIKRGLNIELAEVGSALHDIYVIMNGSYKDHAIKGGPIAEKILRQNGGFSDKKIKTIVDSVIHHSEKNIYSNNPYIELIKDVDAFDCSLYKGAEGDYRINKSDQITEEYIKRIKKVRKELGLGLYKIWRK